MTKIDVDGDTLVVIDDYARVFKVSRQEALRMIISGFAHPPDHEMLHDLLEKEHDKI